jgi:hypothetical protein
MSMNKWCSTVIAMLRHAFLVSFHASRIYCYLYYCVLHIYCDAICLYMNCAVCFLFHFSGYFIIALDPFFIATDNRGLF